MKRLVKGLLIAVAGLMSYAVVDFVRARGSGGDGVIARLEDADGARYVVTQEWNDWTEPYTISFFRREPDGRWGWCYIHHQSHRWRSAELQPDAARQCVRVVEDGVLIGEYSKASATFSLFAADGSRTRTLAAPQEWRSPPFTD
ncbi:MAG: hypothetical protein ABI054_02600 [Planctomycetota bacterium]